MNQLNGSSVQERKFPPERYRVKMVLNCFVLGNGTTFTLPFSETIVIKKEEYHTKSITIDNLKEYIYERKYNILKDLTNDASKLGLWHVNVDEVADVFTKDDIVQKLKGNKMISHLLLSKYVSGQPPEEKIHIIIQPPATTGECLLMIYLSNKNGFFVGLSLRSTTTGGFKCLISFYFTALVSPMYIPSDEIEIEIKNKVVKAFPRKNPLSIDQLVDALALIWHIEVVDSDSPGQQNDPYVELKKEPSFFKVNLPRGITKNSSKTVDLCLPSYSKSGINYYNPFYDDPQFTTIVNLVQKKIEDDPGDVIVLAGVSGGGKTSTAFGIAMENWSIYIDFSPRPGHYRGSQLQSELEKIRGMKPQLEHVHQQNKVFHMLDIAIVSRGLLLIKMLTEGKISTPLEWLLVQLRMADSEIRMTLGNHFNDYDNLSITALIQKINYFLDINHLVLIFDEAQVLCEPGYGKYEGSTVLGKKWNLLQGYVAHLTIHPVTCLLAGTYMHMVSGISLVTSVGKVPNMKAHIVLKLPFLEFADVIRNLNAVIDLTHVMPKICKILGYLLQGRPRNCASFVRLLISEKRSIGETKNQVLKELIPEWHRKICLSMAKYLETACESFGADHINPETAIMDVLRLRVFYNHNYNEAIKLLQHSIIPCMSPKCIVIASKDDVPDVIKINPSLESYLIDGIALYFKTRRQRQMVDIFVDNIITLNNISSIGNEFDAVFITAIINKRTLNVRKELNKWKNGQQFDLPSWITPTMEFVTAWNLSESVPIVEYVNGINYYTYAIQPDIYSGSDVVMSIADNKLNVVLLSASCTISSSPVGRSKVKKQLIKSCMRFQYMEYPKNTKKGEFSHKKRKFLHAGMNLPNEEDNLGGEENEEDNLEGEENEEYDQDLNYDNLDFDLNYTKNIKGYQISKTTKYAEYHEQIKNSTNNRKHIYISVELPHRASKRSELFRLNEYGDLVIIVDDRNAEHVFGPAINRLMERIRYKENQKNSINQEDLMDQTE